MCPEQMTIQMGLSLMGSHKDVRMSGTKFFDFLEAIDRMIDSAETAVKDVDCLKPFDPRLGVAAQEVQCVCITFKVQVIEPNGQSTSLIVQLMAHQLELICFACSLIGDAAPIGVDVADEKAARLTLVENTVGIAEEVVIYHVAQLSW
jgi:hypothetical protein